MASADVWEWIYLEAPISIPNPGLALAHPLWGSLGEFPRLFSQLPPTARRQGRPPIGPVPRPDPAPILPRSLSFARLPLSQLPPFPTGGARRSGAGQRTRFRRPLAGPAHLPGTSRRPAGRGRGARACWTWPTRRVSVRWRGSDGLAEPTRGARRLCRPGPALRAPTASPSAYRRHPLECSPLFALRYRVTGREFWDNNGGRDYALRPEHPQWRKPGAPGLDPLYLRRRLPTAEKNQRHHRRVG